MHLEKKNNNNNETVKKNISKYNYTNNNHKSVNERQSY
jgi:hypothetical protein